MTARIAATDEHSVSTVISHVGQRHWLVVKQEVRDRPWHAVMLVPNFRLGKQPGVASWRQRITIAFEIYSDAALTSAEVSHAAAPDPATKAVANASHADRRQVLRRPEQYSRSSSRARCSMSLAIWYSRRDCSGLEVSLANRRHLMI